MEKRCFITDLPGHFSNAEKTEWMLSSSSLLQFCRLEDDDSPLNTVSATQSAVLSDLSGHRCFGQHRMVAFSEGT